MTPGTLQMAETGSQINLWVRAEMHLHSEETLALIPAERHEQYAAVISELGASACALQDAQLRHTAALLARATFFEEII